MRRRRAGASVLGASRYLASAAGEEPVGMLAAMSASLMKLTYAGHFCAGAN